MSGMDRLTEMLPCPFCGGAPTLALGRGAYGVNCRCKGESFIQTYGGGFVTTGFTREQAKENAIAAWNRRASQAAPAEEWEACTCGPCPLHPAAPAPSDGLREEPCAGTLLEWMTYHGQPLQLWREADESGISEGSWVVVDNHKGTVMGSGPTAEEALREAYTEALTPAPAQEGGGPLTDRQLRDQITGEDR